MVQVSQPTEEVPTSAREEATQSSAKNYETYTNEYFPDFELNYPADWELATTTENSSIPGLLNREIILTKDRRSILVVLTPLDNEPAPAGFGMPELTKVDNGLYEWNFENTLAYFSSEFYEPLVITSSISAADYPEYARAANKVPYKVVINVDTNGLNDRERNRLATEVRDILSKLKLQ